MPQGNTLGFSQSGQQTEEPFASGQQIKGTPVVLATETSYRYNVPGQSTTLAGQQDAKLMNRMMMANSGLQEGMMNQFREISEINQRSLRDAKNLQDLVNIRVAKVDPAQTTAGISQV